MNTSSERTNIQGRELGAAADGLTDNTRCEIGRIYINKWSGINGGKLN